MTYKVVYISSPMSPVEEILVQGDNRADAYVNACIKLGPNYGPVAGVGAILDVFLVEN